MLMLRCTIARYARSIERVLDPSLGYYGPIETRAEATYEEFRRKHPTEQRARPMWHDLPRNERSQWLTRAAVSESLKPAVTILKNAGYTVTPPQHQPT
jgi:hypothetical protein